MFKPSRAVALARGTAASRVAIRLVWLALCLPLCARAGVTMTDIPVPRSAENQKAMNTTDGAYQIRCWQDGRLLFEENHLTLPIDRAKYGLKFTGTDRHGRPMFVAETRNATCLVRYTTDARIWHR